MLDPRMVTASTIRPLARELELSFSMDCISPRLLQSR
jgi:hypothetical protein